MVLDFIYSMQHPRSGMMTFTNDPDVAEGYARAGYIIHARANTGNGSKVYKYSKTTNL